MELLSSLLAISVLTFVLPSRSTSPALIPHPFLLSFSISTPKNNARALPQSISPSAPAVIVVIVLSVTALVFAYAFRGGFRIEMVSNIESWVIFHTA